MYGYVCGNCSRGLREHDGGQDGFKFYESKSVETKENGDDEKGGTVQLCSDDVEAVDIEDREVRCLRSRVI